MRSKNEMISNMTNKVTYLCALLLLQVFIPTVLTAQSIIGHWKLVEYSYWSAFPDSEYEASVGDYLEINEDGTYYMKYSDNNEDWGEWKLNDDKITFTVTESTDDSYNLPAELKILSLTEDTLEWELDYGFLRFHEKYLRVDEQKEELKIYNETIESVRQKCEELKLMAADFFEHAFDEYTFAYDGEKTIWEAERTVQEIFQVFEGELDAYEGGDLTLKVLLEEQWPELTNIKYALGQMLDYIIKCTVTVNEGGCVRIHDIEIKNETKTIWWFYDKATSGFYRLCALLNIYPPGAFNSKMEIVPFDNYYVLSVIQNGKDVTNNPDIFLEGDIIVKFAENTPSGISNNIMKEATGKKYGLDGKGLPEGKIPGIVIMNGRKYIQK